MQCPQCKAENREGRRFCSECAAPLAVACPACGFVNEAGEKFCGGCAHDLAQPAAGSPPPPTPEAPDAPDATEAPAEPPAAGERRQATVLFSDLSGYTAMNERLDPEEVEAIMSRVKGEAVRIVEVHGGMVSQFVGDEVLALFGIPTAHEDDPRRAVQAAMELHAAARAVSPELEASIGRPLRMHSGVNTGLVVTSSRDIRDGTIGVTGDTVNTAARLKGLAEDDQILVSAETRRRITSYFHTEALSPVGMRGKAMTLIPHRVVGESAVETRFEAAAQRGLSPFVGRGRERDILQECFEQVQQGRGQAVAVIGEAGLGKTRLIYEFRTALDLSRVNQVRGRCAATGGNLSYLPFIDLLKRWFRIGDMDSPDVMLDKTERSALGLDPGLEEHLPALLHLLSIPSGRAFPPSMAGEAIQRKIVAALRACLTAGCREQPLVMVFEDLHWVDSSSESLLHQYLEAIPAQAALLVLSYRPEYRPPWGHYSHLTPLALRSLPESGTTAIMAATLKTEALPEGLAHLVHRHTEGNPFFTEEVALSMADEGLVRRDKGNAVLTRPVTEIKFPDSVQELVRARIDRLEGSSREVLRLASVVGREFTEGLVARLSRQEAVSKALGSLKTLEMILEKRFEPELEYMFKHAITHQVAYESLLLARRRALHKLVGLGIEELYAERVPEFYEMLAHHFEQGEVWDKAVDYLVKAGLKSQRNFALEPALSFFDRALKILQKENPAVPWQTIHGLHTGRGATLGDQGQWVYAVDDFRKALEVSRDAKAEEATNEAAFLYGWAGVTAHKYHEVKEVLGSLEALGSGDLNSQINLATLQAWLRFFGDEDAQQGATVEADLQALFDKHSELPAAQQATTVLGIFSRWRGDFERASAFLGPALPTLKETAPANMYLLSLFMYGLSLGDQGRYQEAMGIFQGGREFGEMAGERYSTPKVINSIAWVYHELGQYERAVAINQESLDAFHDLLGGPGTSNLFEIEAQAKINLGESHLMLGDLERSGSYLEEVYAKAQQPEYFSVRARWKPRCLITLGEWWLAMGEPAKARHCLDEVREHGFTDKWPYRKYQVRAGRLRGNILAAQGKAKEAEAELKKALKLAKELGNPAQHWRTAQALGDYYAVQKKGKQAATQFRAALKVMQEIADGLTDPELKEGFLTSATFREVAAQADGS